MIKEPPTHEAVYGKFSILGKEAFKEKVIRQNYSGYLDKLDVVEIPELKSSRNNVPRKIFLYLLKKYPRLKLSEIAVFSGTLPNSCGSLILRFRNKMKQSKELKKLVNDIEEQIRN